MNKIIPFNKEITFNGNIGEIVSIALDDNLKFTDLWTVGGDLVVRGTHKLNNVEEEFSYTLPVLISVDSKYNTNDASVSVDDFYYEIVNDNVLRVKIDLLLDNIYYQEEKKNEKENFEREELDLHIDKGKSLDINFDLSKTPDNLDISTSLSGEIKDESSITTNEDNNLDLFKNLGDTKDYSVYRVYTVLDGDTIESILDKYKISKDDLLMYNDGQNIKVGTKLIIPSVDE